MNKGISICVGIHIANQIIDLQIPTQVSIRRLKELLIESFELLSIQLPASFELIVLNKPIHLSENHLIAEYPIGNGDQLLVKEVIEEKNA